MSSTVSGRGTLTTQGPAASANKKEEETSPLCVCFLFPCAVFFFWCPVCCCCSDVSLVGSVVAAVVAFYFAVSLSLVFLNKYLMNYADFKFPYPRLPSLPPPPPLLQSQPFSSPAPYSLILPSPPLCVCVCACVCARACVQ